MPELKLYSENLIVYPGQNDIHIFDCDREQWVINNNKLPDPPENKKEKKKKKNWCYEGFIMIFKILLV